MLLVSSASSAQEVIYPQGDSYSSVSDNIDFTIGEVVINTATNRTEKGAQWPIGLTGIKKTT